MDAINLFMSHCGDDEGYLEKFKDLIGDHYDIRDSSLYESDDNSASNVDYIKTLIRPLIDWAGTFVVLIGDKTAERDFVNWEIEYAMSQDKNIVGVYLPGKTEADLPEGLNEYGSSIVTWDSKRIVDAINGMRIFEDSSGIPRPADGAGRATC